MKGLDEEQLCEKDHDHSRQIAPEDRQSQTSFRDGVASVLVHNLVHQTVYMAIRCKY